jgi:hypothetical protein
VTEKYGIIDAQYADSSGEENAPTIAQMCGWLEVSRSGYYDWLSRPESETAKRMALLKIKIKALFDANNEEYGYRRIHAALVRGGEQADDETVRKLMRELGLEPCQTRPWRHSLTEQGPSGPIPDLVNRDFSATVPGAKMVGDITYSAQSAVMCSPGGRCWSGRGDVGGGAAHNHRSSRNARSRSPGWNRAGTGLGSVSRRSTASLAARSASRY